jgi:hypothetical protein
MSFFSLVGRGLGAGRQTYSLAQRPGARLGPGRAAAVGARLAALARGRWGRLLEHEDAVAIGRLASKHPVDDPRLAATGQSHGDDLGQADGQRRRVDDLSLVRAAVAVVEDGAHAASIGHN